MDLSQPLYLRETAPFIDKFFLPPRQVGKTPRVLGTPPPGAPVRPYTVGQGLTRRVTDIGRQDEEVPGLDPETTVHGR